MVEQSMWEPPTQRPIPDAVAVAWVQLLREGRGWSDGKTLAFIEASRKLWEAMDMEETHS